MTQNNKHTKIGAPYPPSHAHTQTTTTTTLQTHQKQQKTWRPNNKQKHPAQQTNLKHTNQSKRN